MLNTRNLERVDRASITLAPQQTSSSSAHLLPENRLTLKNDSHDTGDAPASVSRTPGGQFVITQGDQRIVISRAALPRVIATLYRVARRG